MKVCTYVDTFMPGVHMKICIYDNTWRLTHMKIYTYHYRFKVAKLKYENGYI
jgi:hypothetical protein